MTAVRLYKVKLSPNKGKSSKLDALLAEWKRLVNDRIATFWGLGEIKSKWPPVQYRIGSTLIRRASDKAWLVVKIAQRNKQVNCPNFTSDTIEFDDETFSLEMRKSGCFDGWVNPQILERGKRPAIPFKSHRALNAALRLGKLAGTVKIQKNKSDWFLILFVKCQVVKKHNDNTIGIDVGANLAAVTSTSQAYGENLMALRVRTRHRKYRLSAKMPYRQGLNHVAKQIVAANPNTDFAMERLHFSGKRSRSKMMRRRLQNFAYGHLACRMEELGVLKCFQVYRVNPAYTSQRCPACGHTEKQNRHGGQFDCLKCGFTANADVVGALNINGGKAVRKFGDLVQAVSLENRAARVTTDVQSRTVKATNSEPALKQSSE